MYKPEQSVPIGKMSWAFGEETPPGTENAGGATRWQRGREDPWTLGVRGWDPDTLALRSGDAGPEPSGGKFPSGARSGWTPPFGEVTADGLTQLIPRETGVRNLHGSRGEF